MSDRRRAAQLLSGAEFQTVLEATNDFFLIVAPDGTIQYINRVLEHLDEESVYTKSVFDFMTPESQWLAREAIDEAVRSQKIVMYESVGSGQGGTRARYITRVVPLSSEGPVTSLAMISTDVSSLRENQRALEESREHLQVALSATGMGLWSFDLTTDRIEWDDTMYRIFGIERGAAPRTFAELKELVSPDDRPEVEQRLAAVDELAQRDATEHRVKITRRSDGQVRWVLTRHRILRDESGRPVKVVGGTLDVTDSRLAEQRLRESERAELLAQLSASVAHNFNNLLMVILPSLASSERDPARSGAHLRVAREAAEQAAEVVRGLLAFAGKHESPARIPLGLGPLLEEVVALARGGFPSNTTIELRCESAPQVLGSAVQLKQVFLNLLLNARDAMKSTAAPRLEIVLDTVEPEAAGPRRARVRVRDNGHGMDEATRARAFEPFFTTRPAGQGTGLGLASALAMVLEHGGTLTCDSAPGAGAELRVELPVIAPASAERAAAEVTGKSWPAGARLLLVDDSPNVLRTTAMVLRDQGFEVTAVGSGGEALRRFAASPDAFDVVLSDVAMPGMSGHELLAALRRLRAEACLLLFSGLPVEGLGAADGFILKPIDGAALARRIQAVRVSRPG